MTNTQAKRWISLAFCAIFIAITTCSYLILIRETAHSHHNCIVCQKSHVAKRITKLAATGGNTAVHTSVLFLFQIFVVLLVPVLCSNATLISQKTRMNN